MVSSTPEGREGGDGIEDWAEREKIWGRWWGRWVWEAETPEKNRGLYWKVLESHGELCRRLK